MGRIPLGESLLNNSDRSQELSLNGGDVVVWSAVLVGIIDGVALGVVETGGFVDGDLEASNELILSLVEAFSKETLRGLVKRSVPFGGGATETLVEIRGDDAVR